MAGRTTYHHIASNYPDPSHRLPMSDAISALRKQFAGRKQQSNPLFVVDLRVGQGCIAQQEEFVLGILSRRQPNVVARV
ncbi:uncharacterized protein BBA_06259 [Beauveria bassiana ARSEF 2860]|uniref:Uncharacterized protein n=1 Tax=Beauveria bassiana (strain ARSEF 2860) TaxID=655819 RepID=J4W2K7_BEAB2|nr:uncharacterized protein BBA_06259 [Beauveria bassiana ARSEF 2860]EJP64690.1 hypothetical protein BBA_06259 [Beauveria bassiana ARSEF 2860]